MHLNDMYLHDARTNYYQLEQNINVFYKLIIIAAN